jgi:alanyl-tRNA synthetase
MTSKAIRQKFLDFFASKGHKIVPSAPIVNKDDPTLMFTNSGMNQFKDYFLGNKTPSVRRIADTQKCLRVSGKHNDLEEVGRDSYHHTMFEMLGNWSFGDYFKKEAIDWAWELLTKEYGLPPDRLYVSVFKGDEKDGLPPDEEAKALWMKWAIPEHILFFGKKDNFWEMGDTGPCGPCSEIHVDLRPDDERRRVDGKTLVNNDNPLVVEIWNLVFIQFNRKADGSLEELPEKHIDTGMGFERLAMALQRKTSNYDTDIFSPFIHFIEKETGLKYTHSYKEDAMSDIAMRVVADHLRAISFAIADGQLPSNNGAGYVIRRILRRAVRYYYSFLNMKEPLLFKIVPLLANEMAHVFPELQPQVVFVTRVIFEEEKSFLRTLAGGLHRLENMEVSDGIVDGQSAFELYDTFGFPFDLTQLIASEKGWKIDEKGFHNALQKQKERGRADAQKQVGDWHDINHADGVEFVGYDTLRVDDALVVKHRTVHSKGKDHFQIVLSKTPFYGESGGQHGDQGHLWIGGDCVRVLDTQKENDLIIHIVDRLPDSFDGSAIAEVAHAPRRATSQNHSAVHLMHAALHEVLGNHALQRGQDVDEHRLRFDFSHFQKMTDEELSQVEAMVNKKIRENILLEEQRDLPIDEARKAGATMLFGEKYGDKVRMITFDKYFSRELCGGTHVGATGEIGLFKILSEGALAAGVRRIEAVTGQVAEEHVSHALLELRTAREMLKSHADLPASIEKLLEENKHLQRELEQMKAAQAGALKGDLKDRFETKNGAKVLVAKLPLDDAQNIKSLMFQLEAEVGNACIVFGALVSGKPHLAVIISKNLLAEKGLNAANIVRELAKDIQGGGGGQDFFATAGGKNPDGLQKALAKAEKLFA